MSRLQNNKKKQDYAPFFAMIHTGKQLITTKKISAHKNDIRQLLSQDSSMKTVPREPQLTMRDLVGLDPDGVLTE